MYLSVLILQLFVQKVFSPHMSGNNRMKDFCDAAAYRSHPVFSVDPCALQIQVYYDDIDVCNPIGSKSVIHKLGKLPVRNFV